MRGTVYQISIKPETGGERGLPKHAVDQARLGKNGLDHDYNRFRQEKLAGDPDSAVLILTWEAIEALNQAGWPVKPGDLGENIMTTGLGEECFRPGHLFRLGDEAVVQISRACDPCDNLRLLPYVGSQRLTEFMKTLLGRRGWYARVHSEGVIRTGDIIRRMKDEGVRE